MMCNDCSDTVDYDVHQYKLVARMMTGKIHRRKKKKRNLIASIDVVHYKSFLDLILKHASLSLSAYTIKETSKNKEM